MTRFAHEMRDRVDAELRPIVRDVRAFCYSRLADRMLFDDTLPGADDLAQRWGSWRPSPDVPELSGLPPRRQAEKVCLAFEDAARGRSSGFQVLWQLEPELLQDYLFFLRDGKPPAEAALTVLERYPQRYLRPGIETSVRERMERERRRDVPVIGMLLAPEMAHRSVRALLAVQGSAGPASTGRIGAH